MNGFFTTINILINMLMNITSSLLRGAVTNTKYKSDNRPFDFDHDNLKILL